MIIRSRNQKVIAFIALSKFFGWSNPDKFSTITFLIQHGGPSAKHSEIKILSRVLSPFHLNEVCFQSYVLVYHSPQQLIGLEKLAHHLNGLCFKGKDGLEFFLIFLRQGFSGLLHLQRRGLLGISLQRRTNNCKVGWRWAMPQSLSLKDINK